MDNETKTKLRRRPRVNESKGRQEAESRSRKWGRKIRAHNKQTGTGMETRRRLKEEIIESS